jgi:hypothetical protein
MKIKYLVLLVSFSILCVTFMRVPSARAEQLTKKEQHAIWVAHPGCGGLIIYASTIANSPDASLQDNLKLADKLAAAWPTTNADTRDTVGQGFRTVAIWVDRHKELPPHAVQKYWTAVCEQMEQCNKNLDPRSAACTGTAFDLH